MLAPIISQLPFSLIYPTGERQEQNTPKHEKFFKWADIIAGDFLFIKRYMPANLKGKILTTPITTTARDLDDLKKRGLRMLITTTPELKWAILWH